MRRGTGYRRFGLAPLILLLALAYIYFQTAQDDGASEPPAVTPALQAGLTTDMPTIPVARATNTPAVINTKPAATAAAQSARSFDYYLLVLSWSPDYCSANGDQDQEQCALGKRLGFVLHGLWPQYEKGYPSSCSTIRLPADVKARFPNLYPSASLYDHEWEKHGTCSGLAPEPYLSLSKTLKESVAIPAAYRAPAQPIRVTTGQMKNEFVAANPGLSESALAVTCSGSGRFLQELEICYTPAGKPRTCSAEIQAEAGRSCGNADLLVRSVR